MFNRTALGDVSPILPIDFSIHPGNGGPSPVCQVIAPRTRILLCDVEGPTEFRLQEGCIALYQSLRDGRRQILDILGPGSPLRLSIGSTAGCNAETLTFTRLQSLGAPMTDRAAGAVLKQMLRRSQALAILLCRKTAQEKVASALLDLARQFARPSKAPGLWKTTFRLHLTRADLADWLGLTLETVSRCLNHFKRIGLFAFKHPEIITIADETTIDLVANGQHGPAYRTSSPERPHVNHHNTGAQYP